MKKFLIASLLITLSSPVLEAFSSERISFDKSKNDHNRNLISFKTGNHLKDLENAIKIVALRLQAGVSLRDMNDTFRPLIDTLALAETDNSLNPVVQKGQKAFQLFLIYKAYKEHRIERTNSTGFEVYGAKVLASYIDEFNKLYLTIDPNSKVETPEIRRDYISIDPAKNVENVMYDLLIKFLKM